MSLRSFHVDASTGHTVVTVDGEVVVCAAIQLNAGGDQPPVLTLLDPAEGTIQGLGIVQTPGADTAESIRDFLGGIDPGMLDEMVLAERQVTRGTFGELALIVLARLVTA